MRFNFRAGLSGLLLLSAACFAQSPASQPTLWSQKPDVAAFEKTENDYLAAAQKDVDQIVAVKGTSTVSNTLDVYDDAIRNLQSAGYFAGLMQQVHPDAPFRDKAEDMTRKISAAQTALALNQEVYKALSALDISTLDASTQYYVKRQLLEFKLAGVDKDEATRNKLKELNDKLTDLQSKFDRNISDGQLSVTVDDVKELDGLPADYIARHKPGADGKIVITTDYPDILPALKFANSAELRRRLYIAFLNRAYPSNKAVLTDMIQTRNAIANLIGYQTWADYNAADKMIGNGANIAKFISELNAADRPIADREFQMLLAEKRKTDPNATAIEPYETGYYSELVRRAKYDFDSASVRPYLPYNEVKAGILNTAQKLFNIEFKQEVGAPGWAPDVETWDVYDHGKMIGRFYLDMHPRKGKFSHAEMVPVLDGIKGKQLPEAALICNFPAPTADDPGLMEFSDVETFFHEFGHLMHMILGGQQPYAGIAGISMEADFVEAPSQMLENWMHNAAVLSAFAKNYKTGEPIPQDLVARMDRALAFGRGLFIATQARYTAISYDIYSKPPDQVDLDAVTMATMKEYTPYTEVPGTHMWASFGHLAGYSSAYYTYMWDKVIAQDFYAQFNQDNPMLGDTPARYRMAVLAPGGSKSANDLVKNFLGRPQNTKAFQAWMSQEFTEDAGANSHAAAAKQQ
ncbi:MAG TPA: M3 family metallopeptidase [Terriglobales bacterium]|nr:M3 family metallopeptidase [Terriglobales bacterium]